MPSFVHMRTYQERFQRLHCGLFEPSDFGHFLHELMPFHLSTCIKEIDT
jgi:hypothetical protein